MKPKKSNRGGRRLNAGRKPGVPNKSTEEVRELIRSTVDFEKLIRSLGGRALKGNMKAAKLLFEYAYGKPPQQVNIGGEGIPILTKAIVEIVDAKNKDA